MFPPRTHLPALPAARFGAVPHYARRVPGRLALRSGSEPFASDRFERVMQRIILELTRPGSGVQPLETRRNRG
jgi:hypothetical protein